MFGDSTHMILNTSSINMKQQKLQDINKMSHGSITLKPVYQPGEYNAEGRASMQNTNQILNNYRDIGGPLYDL